MEWLLRAAISINAGLQKQQQRLQQRKIRLSREMLATDLALDACSLFNLRLADYSKAVEEGRMPCPECWIKDDWEVQLKAEPERKTPYCPRCGFPEVGELKHSSASEPLF